VLSTGPISMRVIDNFLPINSISIPRPKSLGRAQIHFLHTYCFLHHLLGYALILASIQLVGIVRIWQSEVSMASIQRASSLEWPDFVLPVSRVSGLHTEMMQKAVLGFTKKWLYLLGSCIALSSTLLQ
jgi:hypothetical protein